jgi:hypothetical protein
MIMQRRNFVMLSACRTGVIAESIHSRLRRDGFSDLPDLFTDLRENKNMVLDLIPFLSPPAMVIPSKSVFPSSEEVVRTLDELFESLELPVECAIVGLIYIDRIRALSALHKASWRLVVSVAFLLAAKVWEDAPRRWNLEFANSINVSSAKLSKAEARFCDILAFNLHVDAEEYRQYTLLLRKRDVPVLAPMKPPQGLV